MKIWSALQSETDLDEAIARLEQLMDVKKNDPRMNEFLLLGYLIEEYEDKHYPIGPSTPERVIRFMMDMKGYKQKDLIPVLGSRSQLSKILSGARALTPEKIVKLSDFLGCPATALLPISKHEASTAV